MQQKRGKESRLVDNGTNAQKSPRTLRSFYVIDRSAVIGCSERCAIVMSAGGADSPQLRSLCDRRPTENKRTAPTAS
ncbi:hypothetical protein F2P81_009948 [Scophthalmus maximus]|uniref:Uncharacterized protein n=1 Tax=Scophthalmus maximus TaxID=52904 RepID=A0A6A4T1E0_SCOMX|nr:hypothetical protein F2P81_009948 [Scophthalmus maximus]